MDLQIMPVNFRAISVNNNIIQRNNITFKNTRLLTSAFLALNAGFSRSGRQNYVFVFSVDV